MPQLKQSASVTNGSQTVTMTGDFRPQIKTNFIFMVEGELVPYTVSANATYDAGTNLTTFILTGAYQGTTNATAGGLVVNDYTSPDQIPTLRQGDVGTASIFTQAMSKIQSLITSINNTLAGKANTSDLAAKANASDLTAHTDNIANPHSVTKAQVGLGNVDNTSDANKPISTATQTALNGKAASNGDNTQDFNAKNLNVASLNGGPLAGLRNRIINGDFRIDQRYGGAAVSVNASALFYLCDRWSAGGISAAGVLSIQRISGQLPMAPYVLRTTTTTAATPSGNQTYNLQQRIEGFNVADLQWGTANAQAISLSFTVRSSLVGQFSGAIQNGAQNRSYPFTFYVATANTPIRVTMTIPGDTTGAWAQDSTCGMLLVFDLGGAGTARSTANSWQGVTAFGVTGSLNLVAIANATLDISEVQVEAGSTPTPFERRPVGMELMFCKRYYEIGEYFAAANYATVPFVVEKRAVPTLTITPDTSITPNASQTTYMTASNSTTNTRKWTAYSNGTGYIGCTWSATAEL